MGFFKITPENGRDFYRVYPTHELCEALRLFKEKDGREVKSAERRSLVYHVHNLLAARGPSTRGDIARELLIQAVGIDKSNVEEVTDDVIAELLDANLIAPVDLAEPDSAYELI